MTKNKLSSCCNKLSIKYEKGTTERSSHRRCSTKKVPIFRGKHLCWILFNNVAGLQVCDFIKKRLEHRCSSVNIAKFLRTPTYLEESL